MTESVNSNKLSKAEILAQLQEQESKLAETTSKHTSAQAEVEKVRPEAEALEKAYEEIKARFDAAQRTLREKSNSVQECIRTERYLKQDIEDTKRELKRILDSEAVDQEYRDLVESFREKALASNWREENRDDGLGIYRHQMEGAIHLAVTKSALLGDKRGLGKTLTALATLDLVEAKRVIFLSPNDLVNNFINEIKLWAPHRNPWSLNEMSRGQRDFLLPVISQQPEFILGLPYSAWRKDKKLIQDLINLNADAIIMDEAHHGKNWDTVTAKGLRAIRFGFNYCPGCHDEEGFNPDLIKKYGYGEVMAKCQRCGHDGPITDFSTVKYVIPMTGTAIMNRPQELFPNMHLVDPESFPTEAAFLRDFCVMDPETQRWKWRYGGQARAVEKMGPRYYARSREDTDIIIPPYQVIDHNIDMEEMEEYYPKQYKAYIQARDYAQIILDPDNQTVMTMMNRLAVITRLRQILVWPAGVTLKQWDPDKEEEVVVATLDVHESIKLDKAVEEITESFESGDGSVLFSMFKPGLHIMKDRLNKKGIRTEVYDGSTPRHLKNAIEIDFDAKRTTQQDARWDVLLANYRSAGEGLNFTRVPEEVLLDRYWNPAGEDQASGRINRIGTRRDSMVHKLMVRPSIDSWMESLIDEKSDMVEGFESAASMARKIYDGIIAGDI